MGTTPKAAKKVEGVAPSEAVVERVAASEGVDPTDLVPLYEVIDPDALDRLVPTSPGDESALQITFTYHGYDVTVTGNGLVHLDTDDGTGG